MQITEELRALYELARAERVLAKHKVLDDLSGKEKASFAAAIEKVRSEKKEAADGMAKDK